MDGNRDYKTSFNFDLLRLLLFLGISKEKGQAERKL